MWRLAEVIDSSRNLLFVENGLQRLLEVVRHRPRHGHKYLEQWNSPLNLGEQLCVRKPDEVFKMRGNQLALFYIGELQLELGSGGRERERVGNVCKQPRVAQTPGRFLEIRFGHVLA